MKQVSHKSMKKLTAKEKIRKWMHTKPKFLLKANSNKYKTQHVSK